MLRKIYICIMILCLSFLQAQNAQNYDKVYAKILHETYHKNFDKAITAGDSLYKSSAKPVFQVKSLMLLATLYQRKGDVEKAVNYAEKSKDIIEKYQIYDYSARVFGFLASQYRIISLYDKSKSYTEKALSAVRYIKDPAESNNVMGLMLQELAHYDIKMKQYKKAIFKLEKAQEKFSLLREKDFFTATNNQLMGVCYIGAGMYDKAIAYYKEALVYANKNIPKSTLAGKVFQGLTLAYVRNGELDKAKEYLDKAEDYVKDSKYLWLNQEIYSTSQEYYARKNDAQNFTLATEKKDSLSELISSLNTRFLNHQFSKLEKQNTEQEKRNFTKSIFIAVSGIFIIGNLLFFYFYSKAKKKQILKIRNILKNLREKKIEHTDKTEAPNKSEDNPDTTVTLMSLETEQLLLAKLENFEKDKLFKDKKVSLSYVATHIGTNTKYLSFIIKKYKGKDFTTYINELRINYILEKLNTEPVYRQYKISTLAEDAGFSSHSKFATIFKSVTDVSPSHFIKYIETKENQDITE
ncbi:helix-turn-helix domain-containing protein [Elizabethkingia anophelis]